MRPELPLDASDSRCRWPEFGRLFSEVMEAKGLRPTDIARAVGISPEIVRGYRRGFSRPSPVTQAKLEAFLGEKLDAADEQPNDEIMTIPGAVTVQQDQSGDLLVSVRVSRDALAKFLSANAKLDNS